MEGYIIPILTIVFSFGSCYSFFNQKINAIERELNRQKDFAERLTRIEEKTNILISHFINK
jgi:hypothetical protein